LQGGGKGGGKKKKKILLVPFERGRTSRKRIVLVLSPHPFNIPGGARGGRGCITRYRKGKEEREGVYPLYTSIILRGQGKGEW